MTIHVRWPLNQHACGCSSVVADIMPVAGLPQDPAVASKAYQRPRAPTTRHWPRAAPHPRTGVKSSQSRQPVPYQSASYKSAQLVASTPLAACACHDTAPGIKARAAVWSRLHESESDLREPRPAWHREAPRKTHMEVTWRAETMHRARPDDPHGAPTPAEAPGPQARADHRPSWPTPCESWESRYLLDSPPYRRRSSCRNAAESVHLSGLDLPSSRPGSV